MHHDRPRTYTELTTQAVGEALRKHGGQAADSARLLAHCSRGCECDYCVGLVVIDTLVDLGALHDTNQRLEKAG